ncbi:MAG: NAD(P)H-quinone oxidoreductase [Hyphomicrobiaceae bacterium]|nr:NAD(P)H-quinone oxidoreductase [Hyphomicrobiaceae bacterium]
MTTLPDTMTAIAITEPGGPDVLQPQKAAVPEPGPGQLLVRVEYAGVNRPDIAQRTGSYPPPPGASELPGLEISGQVVATGSGTSRFKTGDVICALTSGGGYAEYCLADEPSALPVPKGLSMEEAAALPETFFTVWHNVFERGTLKSGDWLLVHGGSSGIGTTAIQLGVAFGAKVLATAGSAEKCAACEKLGATRAINYRDEDFVAVTKEATDGQGADVILDMVGGSYIDRNFSAAATDGHIVQIAFLEGAKTEANFVKLMLKRLTYTGSTLRPRTVEVKGGIARALEEKVWPLIEAGKVKPVLNKTFDLKDAARAHAHMESGAHIGKIMLRVA